MEESFITVQKEWEWPAVGTPIYKLIKRPIFMDGVSCVNESLVLEEYCIQSKQV